VLREWKETFGFIVAEVAKRHLKIKGLVRKKLLTVSSKQTLLPPDTKPQQPSWHLLRLCCRLAARPLCHALRPTKALKTALAAAAFEPIAAFHFVLRLAVRLCNLA
jgi:hypothetical protein